MNAMIEPPRGESLFFSASDGLKLHARRFGRRADPRLPVICLPGLSRNTEDFEALGLALSAGGRRVVSIDYRGRGLSEYDTNWRNYDVRVELDDLFSVMAALGMAEAIFVATSRGGLIGSAMAAVRPTAIAGIVLNDIGPVIEGAGLARIRGYIGKLPAPQTLEEGAEILKRIGGSSFPAWTEADWLAAADRTWSAEGKPLKLKYDVNLMRPLAAIDLDQPMPSFWPQFEALSHAPVLVIRGEKSDLLSHETALEMTRRHPHCRMIEVPGQGHAPHLDGEMLIAAIARFTDGIDHRG